MTDEEPHTVPKSIPFRHDHARSGRRSAEAYYRERAPTYDRLYRIAEFQDDLVVLRAWLAERVRGRTVLEVAAGTGYWTEAAAAEARAITATDYNPETLAIAAKRRLGPNVTLLRADAYALPEFECRFEVGMAHLWWSHVRKQRRRQFLSHFASRLQPGAMLLMIDQTCLKGLSIPASRRDRHGNRYELRSLGDMGSYEIVKNYPSAEELRDSMAPVCVDTSVMTLRHFWALAAHVRS